MDGSTHESNDSDSGDSWTLLEHNPAYGDDNQGFSEHPPENREDNLEKDDDTDGISIITDSEPDSPSPCPRNEHYMSTENHPTEHDISKSILVNQPLSNNNNLDESVTEDDDFLGVNNIKHKTYVHRRNKRLSTVLNIIVLGSVITAVGVAIGHMWGAKNDCSMHTTPTVNKILSNLYKLQEENAYLRSKLKEITILSNYQTTLQETNAKQNRCRKMFEESLNNDNIKKLTKCLDDKIDHVDNLNTHLIEPVYEKEFISDIEKLKNVYLQNKSWLDEEINQRLKLEEESVKKLKNKHNSRLQKINEEKDLNHKYLSKDQEVTEKNMKKKKTVTLNQRGETVNEINNVDGKIVSYADSLKSTEKLKKNNIKESKCNKTYKTEKKVKNNKKLKGDLGPNIDYSESEEEFKKDNRHTRQKLKPEKNTHDKQKAHKKQKRRNKYEQWEMKGGLMKDYDDISLISQDTDYVLKNFKNDIEDNMNYLKNEISDYILDKKETMECDVAKTVKGHKIGSNINVEANWFDKRANFRTEARKKLEQELFAENPNTAGWYFRRMNKREQCRAKGDNSTFRKLLKRNMNFKMRH